MGRFTEEQKRIAVLLLHSPKTVEEINKQLSIPYDDLNENLKQMLKLKVVKVEGYPQKYKLVPEVVDAIKKRQEIQEKDPFEVRLRAVIEVKAAEETFLEKQVDKIEKKLRDNKSITIYDIFRAKPVEDESILSTYLEVEFTAKDFSSMVNFMYFFGPVSVEVIKPAKIVITADDLQDGLVEMLQMIQLYNHAMLKSMSKEELNEFSKKLYSS